MKRILNRIRSSSSITTEPDTMLTGNLRLEWELPSRLKGQDIRECVLASSVLTLKDGVVHIGRCEHEVAKFYGSVGSRVLEGVISALDSPPGLHSMVSKSRWFRFCTNLIRMRRRHRVPNSNLAQAAQMFLCHHGSQIPVDFQANTIMNLSS